MVMITKVTGVSAGRPRVNEKAWRAESREGLMIRVSKSFSGFCMEETLAGVTWKQGVH